MNSGPFNPSTQDEPALDGPRGSETVLVVDDEPLVLRLCCSILERQGYEVLSADGAEEALRICEKLEKKPHLLLSDILMPKINGTALAQRVSRTCPGIRILFMSGFDGREIPEYEALCQTDKLIRKPFTPRELLLAVRAALDKPPAIVVS